MHKLVTEKDTVMGRIFKKAFNKTLLFNFRFEDLIVF